MKQFFHFSTPVLLLAGISACGSAFASQNSKTNSIQLISGTENESVIKFTMKDYGLNSVTTPWGEAKFVHAENTTPLLKQGAPNIPKFAVSVMIPDDAKMDVQVVSSNYVDYPNVEIAPSKGNITRDINPQSIPYQKGPEYAVNNFFPGLLADLREPYILRDYRGQTVLVYPFQYNPVTKTLRVYSEITVKVFQSGTDGTNAMTRTSLPASIDKEFANIYESHFLNAKVTPLYTPIAEFGKMLIISYGSYMAAMQPFVDWKIKTGLQVTMVNVTTAGATATAIKSYVQSQFNAGGGLTFLLLVGDAAQVPTMVLPAGDSDNGYSYLVGSDNYPDILVGRFSSESTAHVSTQVDRIIRYEKFPQAGGTWYDKGVGIASDQGPGDDNEYDWQHERNIRTELMNFTYATVDELYDGSQGGADASGNPSSSMLSTIVNNGVSVINYTGHGSQTSWVTTGFSNTSINALNNTDKYPFVWSVGCVNGDFNGLTCFGETWLRATDNSGAPAGALSCMASTINQSWNPPMEAQDEFNAILTEAYLNNIKRTFGGISMNGCAKMNDTYGSQGTEMTDTWVLFGDPSVMVRTDQPTPMTVSHVPSEVVGVTQLVITCNTPGALVGLSVAGTWLGSGFVTGTNATITFPAIAAPCTVDVTVTAFNKMPYFGTIPVVNATGGIGDFSGSVSDVNIYPNPVTVNSTITFTITSPENVSVDLFDASGREVMNLVQEEVNSPGTYSTRVNVASLEKGVYFCRVKAGEFYTTRKLVVTK